MKKILLFLCSILLLISCENKEVLKLENEIDELVNELNGHDELIKELEDELNILNDLLKDAEKKYQTLLLSIDQGDDAYEMVLSEYMKIIELDAETIAELKDEIFSLEIQLRNMKYEMVDAELLFEYEHFEEEYGDFTREKLDELMTMYEESYFVLLSYLEIGHAAVDENGDDPIHENEVFDNELNGYRLVTEFDSYDEMFYFYNQWFSAEYVNTLMDDTVGTIDNKHKYVLFEDRLFVKPGYAGDTSIPTDIKKCKYRLSNVSDTEFTMDVFHVNITDSIGYHAEVLRGQFVYRLEENGWKLHRIIGGR